MQVKALTAENDTLQSQVAKQRSTQAGELRNVELVQRELNGRLEDLAEEKKLLREQLAKANLTAALQPDAVMLRYALLPMPLYKHVLQLPLCHAGTISIFVAVS